MAVDETLLEGVRDGHPVTVRFYAWSPPCLSFGRNQPARDVFDGALAASRGIDIVRRPTGGQAVFHHLEVTYSVAVPAGAVGGPRETYAEINRALVEGLRALGVAAAVSPAAPVIPGGRNNVTVGLGPCFQQAAPGEVVVGGQKLVGSAQRCDRRIILQHGSILIDGDQAPVLELQGLPSFGAHGATTLRELLGSAPNRKTIEDALAAGFERYFGISLAPAPLAPVEQERARQLAKRYRSNAWTWRR